MKKGIALLALGGTLLQLLMATADVACADQDLAVSQQYFGEVVCREGEIGCLLVSDSGSFSQRIYPLYQAGSASPLRLEIYSKNFVRLVGVRRQNGIEVLTIQLDQQKQHQLIRQERSVGR